jgi:predicted O-methyltransferase YrrM
MPDALPARSSLSDPKLSALLDRLHAASRGERRRLGREMLRSLVKRARLSSREQSEWAKDFYLSIGRAQGQFLYALARGLAARRVVEFGTSMGISTLYLAAAVRDNGGGLVIGSELHPEKVRRARSHLAEAGLADLVEIREGDALETLRDPGGPVDLAFLDGWKELYVPVLELLAPHLRPGALVVGDNMFTFWRALAPYRAYVRDASHGFRSQTLLLGDGTELSVRL